MLNPGGFSVSLMELLAVSGYTITGSRARRYGKLNASRVYKRRGGSPSDGLKKKKFQRAICGLPLRTPATDRQQHGDASLSISSIQLHGPEGGSVFQNVWSRRLAGTKDEGRY